MYKAGQFARTAKGRWITSWAQAQITLVQKEKKMPVANVLEKPMKMPEIRKKAKSLGITPGKMKKAELIHAVQQAEGYTACFGRSNGQCVHADCCFMQDCIKIS